MMSGIYKLCVIFFLSVAIIHDIQLEANNLHWLSIPFGIDRIFGDNWNFRELKDGINNL